jgi:hypothetical protein
MSTTAKKVTVPTLRERANALFDELLEAPGEAVVEVLNQWRDMVDQHLLEFSEHTRPRNILGGWIKNQVEIRSQGVCHCRCLKMIKEPN